MVIWGFGCEMYLRACVWTVCCWLVALLWKTVESLGSEASLERARLWVGLPYFLSCFLLDWGVSRWPCALAVTSRVPTTPSLTWECAVLSTCWLE